jgi:hypothetical protein
MAVSYGSASTVVTSTAATITPTMPSGIVAGNLLLYFCGLRQDTASAPTPAGWNLLGTINGGGGTAGNATGPSRQAVFYRVATATGADTLGAQTITGSGITSAHVVRLANSTGAWSVAGSVGSDSTVGTAWSVTGDVNPGLQPGDFVVGHSTSGQSAATWASHAVSAPGVSAWSAFTEVAEVNNTANPDINGSTFYGSVTTGTATGVPTYTATLSGTTTNSRGVTTLVRVREATAGITGSGDATIEAVTASGSGTISGGGGGGLTAADAVRGVTSGQSVGSVTGTSIDVTLDAGVQAGDVCLLQIVTRSIPTGTPSWVAPSGWTQIANPTESAGLAYYYEAVYGTDITGSGPWNWNGGTGDTATNKWSWDCVIIKGTIGDSYATGSAQPESSTAAAHSTPSVPTSGDTVLVAFAGDRLTGGSTWTWPSGWVEQTDHNSDTGTNAVSSTSAVYNTVPAPASTYSVTATASLSGSNAWAALFAVTFVPQGGGGVTGNGAATISPVTASGSGSSKTTGTGSATISAATASGSGVSRITGTGSATISAVTASGSGVSRITGTGSATISAATASGSGVSRITGSGAATVAPVTASASGTVSGGVTGNGAATIAPVTASGSGSSRVTGSGAATTAAAAASGSGTSSLSGSGAATVAPVAASGSGTSKITGSGAATASPVAAQGIGSSRVTGSGAATVATVVASGTGVITEAGTNSVTIAPVTASGTGVSRITGSGSATTSSVVASGAGDSRITGSGAATTGPVAVSGTGVVRIVGSGAATTPQASASGSGVLRVVGSAELQVAAVEASATGLLWILGGGSATIEPVSISGTGSLTDPSRSDVFVTVGPGRSRTTAVGDGRSRSTSVEGHSRTTQVGDGRSRTLKVTPLP